MSNASSVNRSDKRPGQSGVLIGVRLQPVQLDALDQWIAGQKEPLSRPEAVRRLLGEALQT